MFMNDEDKEFLFEKDRGPFFVQYQRTQQAVLAGSEQGAANHERACAYRPSRRSKISSSRNGQFANAHYRPLCLPFRAPAISNGTRGGRFPLAARSAKDRSTRSHRRS